MAKICLECATPKFKGKVEEGKAYCGVCKTDTHTIDGEARRPLCHDCKNFMVLCKDKLMRPALDYGPQYIGEALCMGGEAGLRVTVGRFIQPKVTKYDQECEAFRHHPRASRDGRPNPLTRQERDNWRQYLEMPSAFWLEPRRWEGVIDTHKELFWEKGDHKTSKVGVAVGAIAIFAGLFMAKQVDGRKTGARTGEQAEEIAGEGSGQGVSSGGREDASTLSANAD